MNDFSLKPTPSSVLENLGKRFQQIRKKQKISQADIADRSGVSLGSLKRFEQSGEISLKLVHVLRRLDESNVFLN